MGVKKGGSVGTYWKHMGGGGCRWITHNGQNVWCTGATKAHKIWQKNHIFGNKYWKRIPGQLSQIDVNNQNIVWGVNRYSVIYTANGTKKVKKSSKQMKAKKPKNLKKSKKATAPKKKTAK